MNIPDFLQQDEHGGISLAGHRIGLEHVVGLYSEGYSLEMICEELPTLSLAQVHQTIGFYLENRDAVDQYAAQCEAKLDRFRRSAKRGPSRAVLQQRLEAMERLEGKTTTRIEAR